MKKIACIIIVLFFNNILVHSQVRISENFISTYNEIPQERILINFNSDLLISGEQFLYKVYCINSETNKLNSISKIAYIELIGNDKTVILKHKIRLSSGIGFGDFIIPTTIPSGNYKLIGYTQWMRNGGDTNFFQRDISIINPFNNKQIHDIGSEPKLLSIKNKISNSLNNSEHLSLEFNKKNNFTKREKVTFKINSLKKELSYGNYSISVRKIDEINKPIQFSTNAPQKTTLISEINSDRIFPPEHNGELITGEVLLKKSKLQAQNVKVALSIPGKQFILKITNTNKYGIFYFDLDEEYKAQNAIIQVLGEEREKYELKLHQKVSFKYDNLIFDDFKISSETKNWLIQKNIYNQIENAYFTEKQDTVNTLKLPQSFYKSDYNYNLDDFTRFPTVKETMVEIIENVWITQKKGKPIFRVRTFDSKKEHDLLPLILIDGVLIQNHKDLFDYQANKIKQIKLITSKFSYNNQLFGGVILIETFEENYEHITIGNHIKNVNLLKPIINKRYFKQVYNNSNKQNRIPDYRSQLLWIPNLKLNKYESIITFFTSDNTGDYEICVNGFTNNGDLVSLKEIISVK